MTLLRFPKPYELEGVITLTPKQKATKRRWLFDIQGGVCACGCGRSMTWTTGQMDSCSLDHITIRPMACKKQDAHLRAVRWECNFNRGSKRL